MEGMTSFMSVFNIIIGLFCLWNAIRGKGMAFKNDYPESVAVPYCKMMRRVLWVVGPLALADGVLDYFHWYPKGYETMCSLIIMGILLAVIIAFVIWFRVKFGKIVDKQYKGFKR